VQVEQPGQQLAPGQVAGGADQHDDVILGPRGSVLAHRDTQAFVHAGQRLGLTDGLADAFMPITAARPGGLVVVVMVNLSNRSVA
jgi:hypothetical protein